MRKEFARFIKTYLKFNPDSILLLGDISVGLFIEHEDVLHERVLNVGIAEQTMISFAAGLSREGVLPFVHTISPFMVERAYEQIKLDLSYNKNKCILVSANGPFDYSKLGPTHHCSSDIPLISLLSDFNFALPGTTKDVESALVWAINQPNSTYIRLTNQVYDNLKITAGEISQYKNNRSKINIFIGEALSQYSASDVDKEADSLYIWSPWQLHQSTLSSYNVINIWEPYSYGVIAHFISSLTPNEASIWSHTYPKSIENGIYDRVPYITTKIK
jgi:transketolase